MPRKRKSTKSPAEKQKDQLQFRLMQIKMKVDAYVYSGRPMSIEDAKAYIDEIALYKTQCAGDARFLQVTGKLVHCMKNIIIEQEQGINITHDNEQSTHTEYAQSSPVYSLPDEDRALITQNILGVENQDYLVKAPAPTVDNNNKKDLLNEHTDIEMKTYDLSDKNKDLIYNIHSESKASEDIFKTLDPKDFSKNSNNTNADMEVIDLCDDDDDLNNDYQTTIDVAIHRALSTLSIRDSQPLHEEVACSQSILNNFELNNSYSYKIQKVAVEETVKTPLFKEPFVNKVPFRAVINDKEKQVNKAVHTEEVLKENQIVKKENNHSIQLYDGNKNVIRINESIVVKKITQIPNENSIKFTCDTKAITKRNIKKTKLDDNKIKRRRTRKVTNDKTQVEVKKKRIRKNKPQNTPNKAIVANNSETNHKDSITEINPKTGFNHTKNIIENNVSEIYEKTVIEDLSWVENIKYVREISSDEYDPQLGCVEDCFWDSLMLPAIFNDTDFHVY